jgi:hypothetical protein
MATLRTVGTFGLLIACAGGLDARHMTDVARRVEPNAPPKVQPLKFERAEVIASIALAVAALSFLAGASKASGNDLADVQLAVSDVQANAVTAQDLRDLEDRLGATEKKLSDAEASLASLEALSQDMAAASKVDAIVQDLQSSIASLRSDVNYLCGEVHDLSSAGSLITVPLPFGSC